MKRIAGCLLLLAAARLAAAENMVKLEPSPLELPAKIGPLVNTGAPHKYDQPGLGVSYQYSAEGLSLTVYVYDADQKDIADGADTIASCREFEMARRGIEQSYQKAELKAQRLVRVGDGAGAPLIREAVYEYEREGHATISYVWVTAVTGKFLKLRFSADPRLRDELPDARRALLTDVARALQPLLKPGDSNAKPPGTSINISMGAGAGADMASGMMYLVMLSAISDKSPQLAPVCGGEFIPDFGTELSTWRAVLEMAEGKPKSQVERLIANANKAGFLGELVWVDLHREEWGTQAPDGLDLDGYARWRKKNLKHFARPNFGAVVVDHPRELPIEPL